MAVAQLVVAAALALAAAPSGDAERARAATLRPSDLGSGWTSKAASAPRTPFRGCGTLRFPPPWPRPTASAGVALTSPDDALTFTSQAYLFPHAADAPLVARRVRTSQATASCWRTFASHGTRFVSARATTIDGVAAVRVLAVVGNNESVFEYATLVSRRTLVVLSFLGAKGAAPRGPLERAAIEHVRARISR